MATNSARVSLNLLGATDAQQIVELGAVEVTGTGSKAAGTGSMEAGTGSPEGGTGSPVGSVVAGKGWKTEPASHFSHGLPPLQPAAPGSGQPPVHQGERQRSLELGSS